MPVNVEKDSFVPPPSWMVVVLAFGFAIGVVLPVSYILSRKDPIPSADEPVVRSEHGFLVRVDNPTAEVYSMPKLTELLPASKKYVKSLELGESCWIYPNSIILSEVGYGWVKVDSEQLLESFTFPKVTRVKNGFHVWFPRCFSRVHTLHFYKDIVFTPDRKVYIPIVEYEVEK
jgi:hypothetical protein